MFRLFRSLIVAVALLTAGGASAALAAPATQKPMDALKDKAVELPAEAKPGTVTPPAKKKGDICDYVIDILSRTRFKDGTTKAQVKQYVIDQLAATRLPDGVDVSKPIDSCFPDTAKPGDTTKPADPGKGKTKTDGAATTAPPRHAPPKVDTAAPARSVAPNFTG